jgi:leader peptidase (prepilin peptidase)/N-methyltransferase
MQWSWQTALVVLFGGALGGWLLPVGIAFVLWGAVLGPAAVVDVRERRLPRVLIEPALVFGTAWLLSASAAHDNPTDARNAVVGLGVAVLLLGVPHVLAPDRLGFGDVRFGALIGLFLGWLDVSVVPIALVVASLGAGTAGLVLTRRWRAQVPFGPFLAGAAVCAAFVAVR